MNQSTASELLPLVYDDLLALARSRLATSHARHMAPEDLVHETYLRLLQKSNHCFENVSHFFFAASRAMLDILVENTRHETSLKRGGAFRRVALQTAEEPALTECETKMGLALVLRKLEQHNQELARVVGLRYFAGLTFPEMANALGISRASAERRWAEARGWLAERLTTTCVRQDGGHGNYANSHL